MCGLLGYIGSNSLDKNLIQKTLKLMKNRGPDMQDYKSYNFFNRKITLFHSRLSIIDLNSRSNQPFKYKNLIMIFNGEIYNYQELKKELIDFGYKFETSSDTEVLLKMYYHYGDRAFKKFNGMWSLAILDTKKHYLKLSRDCFGEKPLFLYKNGEKFIFGSEIKYIQSISNSQFSLNFSKIKTNLFFGFKSLNYSDDTFFKKIKKISPGTILTINLKKDITISTKKIFSLRNNSNENLFSNSSYMQNFEKIFFNAIKIRLRSDVPMGFCLSGGIDSSLLVAISQKVFGKKIQTFSIIDDDIRYNEYKNIKSVTKFLGCENSLVRLGKKNFLEDIISLSQYHDGPIATISYFVQSLLLKSMKKKGIKVSISGTGADELFTGYYHHFLIYLNQMKKNKNFNKEFSLWKKNISVLIRDDSLKNINFFKSKNLNDSIFFESSRLENYFQTKSIPENKYYEKKYYNDPLKNRMHNELFHEIVPVILHHDDLNSMFFSIENRSPYLDRDLLLFSRQLKNKYLINSEYQKLILRKLAEKFLPKAIYQDKKKVGFNASIENVIDFKSKKLKHFLFSNKDSLIFDIIDPNKLKDMLQSKKIPNYLAKFIFRIISTKAFIENKNISL